MPALHDDGAPKVVGFPVQFIAKGDATVPDGTILAAIITKVDDTGNVDLTVNVPGSGWQERHQVPPDGEAFTDPKDPDNTVPPPVSVFRHFQGEE
jgi:hypothetical protein